MQRRFGLALLAGALLWSMAAPAAVQAQTWQQRQLLLLQQQQAQRQLYQQMLYQQQLYQQQVAQQLYLQQLAQQMAAQQLAEQQLAQQFAAQQLAQQQAAARQLAQQQAQQERFRQYLVRQQQANYQQLYDRSMPSQPESAQDRRQAAVAKILGAVGVKLIGNAAANSDNDFVAILGPVIADRISGALIESAVRDVCPDMPEPAVRAIARVARLAAEGKLTKIDFAKATARDELLELLRQTDPNIGAAATALDLLVDLGHAASRRAAQR